MVKWKEDEKIVEVKEATGSVFGWNGVPNAITGSRKSSEAINLVIMLRVPGALANDDEENKKIPTSE